MKCWPPVWRTDIPGMNARVAELLASKYRTEAWRSGVRHERTSHAR